MLLMSLGLWLCTSALAEPLCTMRGRATHTQVLGERGELRIPTIKDEVPWNFALEYDTCPKIWGTEYLLECKVFKASNSYGIKLRQVNYLPKMNYNIQELRWEFGGLSEAKEGMFEGLHSLAILSLRGHNLAVLPRIDQVFYGLNNLTELHLESSGIISWDISESIEPTAFPNLSLLSLANNPIKHLTNISFSWLEGAPLKYLNLRGCSDILSVAPGSLSPVGQSLLYLDIGHSNMGPQLQYLMYNVTNLQALGLAFLGLVTVPSDALAMVTSTLEVLSLYGNYLLYRFGQPSSPHLNIRLHRLPQFPPDNTSTIFPYMPQLQELDLRSNNIMMLPKNTFSNTSRLATLLLSDNSFARIEPGVFQFTPNLKYLDMSNNQPMMTYWGGLQLEMDTFKHLNTLETLYLSHSKISILSNNSFKPFGHTLQKLSLCYTQLPFLDNNPFEPLINLEILDISGNNMSNKDNYNFSSVIFYGLNKLKELHMPYCSIETIDKLFTNVTSLEVLNIRGNRIKSINMDTIQSLTQLKKLDMGNNRIYPWEERIFTHQPNISVLIVSNNKLTDITPAMLEDFQELDVLDASHNPYICYCSIMNFSELLSNFHRNNDSPTLYNFSDSLDEHLPRNSSGSLSGSQSKEDSDEIKENMTQGFPHILNWGTATAYLCWNYEVSEIYQLDEVNPELCNNRDIKYTRDVDNISPSESATSTHTAVYVVCGMVIFLSLLTGVCYRNRWYIKHFTRVLTNSTVLTFMDSSKETDVIYQYDVFVSYSDADRLWVLGQLVPELEKSGEVKVCLHERDFQVGVSILENIVSAMDRSRWLLLVLSPSFVGSHWCQFELHLAQHRLLEMRRDHLMLVLLQDIPSSRRPKLLRYLMLTRTYLMWPSEGEKEQYSLFWQRLRKAIGQKEDKCCVSVV